MNQSQQADMTTHCPKCGSENDRLKQNPRNAARIKEAQGYLELADALLVNNVEGASSKLLTARNAINAILAETVPMKNRRI